MATNKTMNIRSTWLQKRNSADQNEEQKPKIIQWWRLKQRIEILHGPHKCNNAD